MRCEDMSHIRRMVERQSHLEHTGTLFSTFLSLADDDTSITQEALPPGTTLLGVVLSSDKTNISVMSGNRMAYLLLISLTNINASIRSKASMHAYLLLALLPTTKFLHKHTHVRGLLQDRLVH